MAELTTETKKQSKLTELVKRMIMEQPMGTVGAIITLILLFAGIFARWLAPYGMNDPHPLSALQGPSFTFWLGTDNIGRDLLSRLVYGARISMIVGLTASLLSVTISVI